VNGERNNPVMKKGRLFMLHVGHFSFDAIDSKGQVRHGYFTCVANSDNAENAVKVFKEYLSLSKDKVSAFEDIIKIYLEDIIQMKDVPKHPVITRLQTSEGQFPRSVSYSLPCVPIPGVESFEWSSGVVQEDPGDQEYPETVPFILFE
jgi:hypothetical protein